MVGVKVLLSGSPLLIDYKAWKSLYFMLSGQLLLL